MIKETLIRLATKVKNGHLRLWLKRYKSQTDLMKKEERCNQMADSFLLKASLQVRRKVFVCLLEN